MNKSIWGFICIVLAIAGLGVGVGFLAGYFMEGASNSLFLWLSVAGWAVMVVAIILSLVFFLRKDEEVVPEKGLLHDPKKPH